MSARALLPKCSRYMLCFFSTLARPELIYWVRCLVPGLVGRANTTVLRPRPQRVEQATGAEVGSLLRDSVPAAASGLLSPAKFVQDRLVVVPRGVLPSKAVDVQKAFAQATGMDRKLAAQELAALGFASKAVAAEGSTVWAYAKAGVPYKLVEGHSP